MGVEENKVPMIAPPGLSLEEMKRFVLSHFQAFVNEKDLTQADRSFSADFLDHDEPTGAQVGVDAAKSMMRRAHVRWPDLRVEVEDILAEADKVMVRNIWTGTEAESQKRIEFHGFVLWRFASGKIVERWATITAPKEIALSGASGHE
jgi:predicted ester cyclase